MCPLFGAFWWHVFENVSFVPWHFSAVLVEKQPLQSIQGIRKHPIYRFEDTIVWER